MQSLYSNVYHVLSVQKAYPRDDIQADIVLWLLWRLWKNRNEFLFKGKEYEARMMDHGTKIKPPVDYVGFVEMRMVM
ncbi:BnaC08g08480D [Brassica napus]|uniref:BnaC08g08480D protein n=1 Tax=Brassica napus TaxID=3708 RepID=A0A078FHA6_BRANA|nr:BnaC08g08480D [Brassica napus]